MDEQQHQSKDILALPNARQVLGDNFTAIGRATKLEELDPTINEIPLEPPQLLEEDDVSVSIEGTCISEIEEDDVVASIERTYIAAVPPIWLIDSPPLVTSQLHILLDKKGWLPALCLSLAMCALGFYAGSINLELTYCLKVARCSHILILGYI
jgi:hypothetical protein